MSEKPNYVIGVANTAMIIVDPQRAFGLRKAPVKVPLVEAALTNMAKVAIAWKMYGGKITTTRHVYYHDAEIGRIQDFLPKIGEIMTTDWQSAWSGFHNSPFDFLREADMLIEKTEFNAFFGTKLEQILRMMGFTTIVVLGLTTPICVEGTARGGHERGFKVILLEDACASQAMGNETAEEAHASTVGRMGELFAEILTTSQFLTRLENA